MISLGHNLISLAGKPNRAVVWHVCDSTTLLFGNGGRLNCHFKLVCLILVSAVEAQCI